MNRWTRLFARLFLLEVVLVALFVAGEWGVRLWIANTGSEEAFRRYASARQLRERYTDERPRYVPHRYLGYTLGPDFTDGQTHHNALGYRGPEIPLRKPDGEFRIVCLGGSTTYTSEVFDDRYTYPAVVEGNLKSLGRSQVRVINAGVGGWNTWESMVNLQFRVLDLDPDMIVIYHAINDVHARIVWPPSAYRGDDSGRRAPLVMPPQMPPLWSRSALLRFLAVRGGLVPPASYVTPQRLLFDAGAPAFYADKFRSQLKAGRYPDGIFERTSAREMLAVNRPIYYRRNLENMIAIARRQGVEVVLVTFVHSDGFPNHPRSSSPEYAEAIAEMNDVMRAVAADEDVPLFDLVERFPRGTDVFADGRHVNVKGAIAKGRLVAEFLVSRGLVPEAP